MTKAIRNIAIIGGDLHAWSFAMGLLSGLRRLKVGITVIDDSAPALPGVTTLDLAAHDFHRKLGVQEPSLVSHIGGAYSFGSRFQGFATSEEFVYTHSQVGEMIDRVQFHDYLCRLRLLGCDVELADYSIAALAARDNRFTHPQPDTQLQYLDYTMQVDSLRYRQFLLKSALDHGVTHIKAEVENVIRDSGSGHLETLLLSDGSELKCDFVVDAIGDIHKSGNKPFDDWSDYLPYNQTLSWVKESRSETPVLNSCQYFERGSLRKSVLPGGEFFEFFHSGIEFDKQAAVAYASEKFEGVQPELSKLEQYQVGVSDEPWFSNVLAIGTASGNAGNLLFGALFHTHTAAERWLALYPNAEVNPLLAGEYNRQTKMEFEHVRDVHCALPNNAKHMPSTLAHRIDLFRKTGRTAFYESDVLQKHQWVNLLISSGVWPERHDPLLNQLPQKKLETILSAVAQQSAELAMKFPKHDQLLKAIRQST